MRDKVHTQKSMGE